MKKILFLTLLFMSILNVKAEELPEITNDIEIRTKWYKEEIVGKYHPKGEDLLGYIENPDKITYGNFGGYSANNCLVSEENYVISKMTLNKYKMINYTKIIKFTNFKYSDNVFVFEGGNLRNFEILSNENDEFIIQVTPVINTKDLMLFVDYEEPYNISIYADINLNIHTISKDINNKKVLIPDKTWITKESTFFETTSTTLYGNNALVTYNGSSETCKIKQIYTYRYKIEKVYYDQEYHKYVENYLPDMTDIKVYYKGEKLIEKVEVPIYEKVIEYKTIEVPKEIIKTIEVPKEIVKTIEVPKIIENEGKECNSEIIKEIKYLDRIKEVYKIPKYIYLIVSTLIILIIILLLWLRKKYVER